VYAGFSKIRNKAFVEGEFDPKAPISDGAEAKQSCAEVVISGSIVALNPNQSGDARCQ
jgi:hypothetical protein